MKWTSITPLTKHSSQWIRDFKTCNYKTNLKGQSLDIGLGNNFWMGHRKQAKKAGLHQTKKLCTALKKQNEEAPMKQD